MAATVSVVIVAQNEERTIGKVLAAVQPLAHEIILVDSGSTDSTIDIAGRFGVRYYHQDWLGYGKQKNYAIGLAHGDWILSLDADEILTPQLVAEIQSVLKGTHAGKYVGYLIPRLLYIGEAPVKHGGFYPDAQLRLFQKGKGRFNERLVHEAVRVDGATQKLKNYMLHMAYRDISEFRSAMEKYARLSAQEFATRSGSISPAAHEVLGIPDTMIHPWWTVQELCSKNGAMLAIANNVLSSLNEMIHPWWTLFYRFVLRAGFLDSKLGWQLNWLYSDYVRMKIRYLRAESAKQR